MPPTPRTVGRTHNVARPLIFLLMGGLLLIYGFGSRMDRDDLGRKAHTEGTVVKSEHPYVGPVEGCPVITVGYTPSQGQTLQLQVSACGLRPGDQVRVVYDPADPGHAAIDSRVSDNTAIVVGLGLAVVGLAGLARLVRTKTRQPG